MVSILHPAGPRLATGLVSAALLGGFLSLGLQKQFSLHVASSAPPWSHGYTDAMNEWLRVTWSHGRVRARQRRRWSERGSE